MLIIIILSAAGLSAQEEFNGPLPGWTNIKTRFGAKGNGKDDDTKAIQMAIDSLTQPVIPYNTGKKAYMVIYLPAGIYNISSTLTLKGKIGVSFIGESPLTTVIKWKGPDSDTIFTANGSAYFKISRLTWDANGHKEIEALGIHWKDRINNERSQSIAQSNIEISDNVFTGRCKYGISGGTILGEGTNNMDAEISIRRCVFNDCRTGILIKGYNALDYWIWDCRFIKCDLGIGCNSGNYHVYRSYFGDCYSNAENTNSYYTSLRGCYSENCAHFSGDHGASSNPFKRIFQGNTVTTPKEMPIRSFHLGKITALDNNFDVARDTSVHAFIETGTWAYGNVEVLSINNHYGYKTAVKFVNSPKKTTLYSIGDMYASLLKPSGASVFISTQDKMPAKINRTIITVPAGANSKQIQELINQAVKLKGSRPIVYFPLGKYILDEPLVVAAGADLQLIGDGYLYSTVLLPSPAFPKGKALINVKGPSSVVIRDMQLGDFNSSGSGANGIQFSNTDQPGSQAFVEQLYTNSHRSIHADGLDYLYIQESNSFFSDGKLITGGPLVQKGKGTAGLYCFGGQFAGLSTDKNAIAVMKDCWWEGAMRKPLDFSGSGRITIDGAMVAPNGADSNTTVSVNRFAGKISLLNMYIQGGVNVDKNNPQLSLLLWNIHFYHALNPLKFITPDANYRAAFMGLTTQCFIPNDKKCENIFTVEDMFKGGVKPGEYFPEMLADDRSALPRKYAAAGKGASSIFISRVSAGDCNTAISFTK